MITTTGTVDELLSPANGGSWADGLRGLNGGPVFARIVKNLPATGGLPAAFGAIAARIPDLLRLDLGVILVGGWKKLEELRRYTDTAKYKPEETIVVELTRHIVSSVHKPTLDIVVDQVKVDTVPFELKITATIDSALLNIRGGKILSVSPGSCKGSLELKCEGYTVLKREPTAIRLPGTWTFGKPIKLEPLTRQAKRWEL